MNHEKKLFWGTQESEDEHLLRANIRGFCAKEVTPHIHAWQQQRALGPRLFPQLAVLGLLAMEVPEREGGSELSTASCVCALHELASVDGSAAFAVSAHNGLFLTHLLLRGTTEQRAAWLPALTSGEAVGAWGITEQQAGCDAAAIQTTARTTSEGFLISGTKTFVSFGQIARFVIISAVTDASRGPQGISAFVVPTDAPGLRVLRRIETLGMRAVDCVDLEFKDVFVPLQNLLGERGEGLKDAFRVLDRGRINVAALACGMGNGALRAAITYARERKQFGQSIGDFQAIQWRLADAATELQAAWSLTLQAARLRDAGQPFAEAGAMAKLYAAQAAVRACNSALQIHGGYGYTEDFPVERFLRDARMCALAGGTLEILRTVVARSITSRAEKT